MEDLALTARLFETSSRLHLAAVWLQKRSQGIEPDEFGREALKWAGKLLSEVDWSSRSRDRHGIGGGFALQATSVRPTFYSSLFRLAPELRKAGIRDNKDVLSFLNYLYESLVSAAPPRRRTRGHSPEQLRLGAALLDEISRATLVQLNNNGLPQSHTPLREGWEPPRDEPLTTRTY